ncbi:MAG: flavodoxin-dependent (E)-4-hydroxy-3-methylbut-2-enyl-diphosphate synthase, partial [Burkholderiales bacterium]|nr:flavodoxin-dependent (E)-4-hydroxy-3-methylbut-2-enyl-diphosphate synthase [Burkholderiales bacterium]
MLTSIKRRETVNVQVGNIHLGSNYPVVVQSMTNTDTENVIATVDQVALLYKAGSEVVRVTVNTITAGKSIRE